jgi:hypothetical protein
MAQGYTRAEAAKRLSLDERTFGRWVTAGKLPGPGEDKLYSREEIDRIALLSDGAWTGDPVLEAMVKMLAEAQSALKARESHIEKLLALNAQPFDAMKDLMAKLLQRMTEAEKSQLDYMAAHGDLLMQKDEREQAARIAELRSKAMLEAIEGIKVNLPAMLAQLGGGGGGGAVAEFVKMLDADEKFGLLMMSTQFTGKKKTMFLGMLAQGGVIPAKLPPEQRAIYEQTEQAAQAAQAAAQQKETSANGHAPAPDAH